jgi:hypothetical protein
MPDLPPAARLVAWGNAALAGLLGADELTDRVAAGDLAPRVSDVPGETGPVALAVAVGRLRVAGVRGLRLVLPVPGDVAGLPGPPPFNEAAVLAGQAAVTVGGPALGALPWGRGAWRLHEVSPGRGPAASVAEADQLLRDQLRRSTEELLRLDVARWQPEVAALLGQRSEPVDAQLPASYPPRAHQLLARALLVGTIVGAGVATEGGAVTSAETLARERVLRRLDVAVRRAVEAACNAALE